MSDKRIVESGLTGPQNIIENLRSYPLRLQWIQDNAAGIADVLEEAWRDGLKWKNRAETNDELLDEITRIVKVGNWSKPPSAIRHRLIGLLEEIEAEEPMYAQSVPYEGVGSYDE